MYRYRPQGVCSRVIEFEVEGGKVTSCRFEGGCKGNTTGVSRLVVGMDVDEVVRRLKGIPCQGGTSCPDQLAIALEEYTAKAKA